MAGSGLELFCCIGCGKTVARPGRLRCEACEADPAALRRTIAAHGPRASQWARLWRILPTWEVKARKYAEGRMLYHRAAMDMAATALKGQQRPLTAELLQREIDRREIGTARMAAHHERVEIIREARQGVIALRAMLERAQAERE